MVDAVANFGPEITALVVALHSRRPSMVLRCPASRQSVGNRVNYETLTSASWHESSSFASSSVGTPVGTPLIEETVVNRLRLRRGEAVEVLAHAVRVPQVAQPQWLCGACGRI